MKKYTWNYAIDGIFTLLPLFITEYGETEQEAKDKAILQIKSKYNNRKITFFTVEIGE